MKMLLTCTLAVVMLTGTAFAQSSSSSSGSGQTVGAAPGGSSAGSGGRNVNGTRDIDGNPRTIDSAIGYIKPPEGDTPLDRENRRLDKAIGNICRGC